MAERAPTLKQVGRAHEALRHGGRVHIGAVQVSVPHRPARSPIGSLQAVVTDVGSTSCPRPLICDCGILCPNRVLRMHASFIDAGRWCFVSVRRVHACRLRQQQEPAVHSPHEDNLAGLIAFAQAFGCGFVEPVALPISISSVTHAGPRHACVFGGRAQVAVEHLVKGGLMRVGHDVDWANEVDRSLWIDAWKRAVARRDLESGWECEAFLACSWMTRLATAELWRSWHDMLPGGEKVGLRFDTVSVEGENLVYALVLALVLMEHAEKDIEQIKAVASELSNAGLVLQKHPGRWELRFGGPFTPEERAERESSRKAQRSAYMPRLRILRGHEPQ